MGNRGCLHDDEGVVRHQWKGRRWISCELQHRDHEVALRSPGKYTPLFFENEASALAAGHRPCAHCRRDAFRVFLRAAERGLHRNPGSLRADALDAPVHAERTTPIEKRWKSKRRGSTHLRFVRCCYTPAEPIRRLAPRPCPVSGANTLPAFTWKAGACCFRLPMLRPLRWLCGNNILLAAVQEVDVPARPIKRHRNSGC